MDALGYGINFIKRNIPKEILNIVFTGDAGRYKTASSMDTMIESALKETALLDLNLISDQILHIPLEYCSWSSYLESSGINSSQSYVIKIPYAATNNREIINALSITVNSLSPNSQNSTSNRATNMLEGVMDKFGGIADGAVIHNVKLIGPNTILVYDVSYNLVFEGNLTVTIENENSLQSASTHAYKSYAKLFVYAMKAYIHNDLVIRLNNGTLWYGIESNIKEVVDEYSSAQEDYDEYFKTVMRKVQFTADSESYTRYLNTISGKI